MSIESEVGDVSSCKNLDELCGWLRSKGEKEVYKLADKGILNLSKLPHFGGEPPQDTLCLSYDETRVLIEYETCDYERRFAIINR